MRSVQIGRREGPDQAADRLEEPGCRVVIHDLTLELNHLESVDDGIHVVPESAREATPFVVVNAMRLDSSIHNAIMTYVWHRAQGLFGPDREARWCVSLKINRTTGAGIIHASAYAARASSRLAFSSASVRSPA